MYNVNIKQIILKIDFHSSAIVLIRKGLSKTCLQVAKPANDLEGNNIELTMEIARYQIAENLSWAKLKSNVTEVGRQETLCCARCYFKKIEKLCPKLFPSTRPDAALSSRIISNTHSDKQHCVNVHYSNMYPLFLFLGLFLLKIKIEKLPRLSCVKNASDYQI
jgi:hypothetical protein